MIAGWSPAGAVGLMLKPALNTRFASLTVFTSAALLPLRSYLGAVGACTELFRRAYTGVSIIAWNVGHRRQL